MAMLAYIPARGGSKGLPGKNSKNFAGEPLIAWTIKAAQDCSDIDEVYVDTDSEEIAEIARRYGASVLHLRPQELASDTAKVMDATKYFLQKYKENKKLPEYFLLLQATSPLRKTETITAAYHRMKEKGCSFLVGVCELEHAANVLCKIQGDVIVPCETSQENSNRQACEPLCRINGALYLARTAALVREERWVTDETHAFIMDRDESIDIDTIEDFEYAEFVYRRRNKQRESSCTTN